MIVDSAIYVDERRTVEPGSLQETYEACRAQRGIAWIGLYKPTAEEFESVAEEFELHSLAVGDATEAHQRPKLERYGARSSSSSSRRGTSMTWRGSSSGRSTSSWGSAS